MTDPSCVTGKDFEDCHLALLYRDSLEYASGRNVAVSAEVRPGERRAWKLETTWLPSYDIPQTVAPRVEETPLLAGLELDMEKLANLAPAELSRALLPLADGYSTWLQTRSAHVSSLPEHLRDTAVEASAGPRQIADRIRAGINLLGTPGNAPLEAFRFAYQAMALQRRHSEIVRERAKNPDLSLREAEQQVDGTGPACLAAIPACVRAAEPARADRPAASRNAAADQGGIVDLLFFPTGGGKTEAYLGLTAYTLAIRRLQGLVGTGSEQRSGQRRHRRC